MRRGMRWMVAAAMVAALGACGGAPEGADDAALELGTRVVKLPLGGGGPTEAAARGAHLDYYGGPVISKVRVYAVYWGRSVPDQAALDGFYADVTSSPYFDWLSEYDTPSQHLGRGSFAGSVVDTGAPSGSTITDAAIQRELSRLISAGKLPPNTDGNNLYMVHFPAGVTITQGGQASCSQFCAYHGTFRRAGLDTYYGVVPDLSGGCARGCGSGSKLDNTTAVASHELIEAVTDAAVGLATTNGPPLAWYDATNGEIGDICNGEQGRVAGHAVQKEWSNARGACVLTGPGSSSGGGTTGSGGGGGTTGSGGCGGTGACQRCTSASQCGPGEHCLENASFTGARYCAPDCTADRGSCPGGWSCVQLSGSWACRPPAAVCP